MVKPPSPYQYMLFGHVGTCPLHLSFNYSEPESAIHGHPGSFTYKPVLQSHNLNNRQIGLNAGNAIVHIRAAVIYKAKRKRGCSRQQRAAV
jgi:hypothetical protein